MILEYKMERFLSNGKPTQATPAWVECGGFLHNPDDFTLIGFSPSVREYKIPDSVLRLTVPECKTRAQNIHALHPFKDLDGNILDSSQVDSMVQTIIDLHDMA